MVEELHVDRVADFLPRQLEPLLFVLFDFALRRSDQVRHLPGWVPHLGQDFFGRNAAIHHPHPLRLAIGVFDLVEETSQRGAIGCVAIHHFIRQWKTIGRDYQRDDEL